MNTIAPLESLFDLAIEHGDILPLPGELQTFYGRLQFPSHAGRSYVISNFVSTLDGVVELDAPGRKGGGDISGQSKPDHAVMGILRALADAVIVGAGTFNSAPGHLWTAEHIYPPFAAAYKEFRGALGKAEPPLNVVVSAQGNIDLRQPVLQSGRVPALIITTERGAQRLRGQSLASSVEVTTIAGSDHISARAILKAVNRARRSEIILTEGGPHLLSNFLAERCLDEQFLTLAPQIAGREEASSRPGLVMGMNFAPQDPRWATLVSVKRAESHLFLRYAFATMTT